MSSFDHGNVSYRKNIKAGGRRVAAAGKKSEATNLRGRGERQKKQTVESGLSYISQSPRGEMCQWVVNSFYRSLLGARSPDLSALPWTPVWREPQERMRDRQQRSPVFRTIWSAAWHGVNITYARAPDSSPMPKRSAMSFAGFPAKLGGTASVHGSAPSMMHSVWNARVDRRSTASIRCSDAARGQRKYDPTIPRHVDQNQAAAWNRLAEVG